MTINLNALKKISQSTPDVVAENDNKKNYVDDRFWKLERDTKTGNGAAVIRFLPSTKENELPWVTTYSYFLKNEANGRWYVEKSRRTLNGEPDPMREFISKKWQAAQSDFEKEELRKNFKERMQYVCNILVVKDPKNPENEGKVFLYSFGPKIMDKIRAKTDSQFDDKCNIFDWVSGANFILQAKRVDKFVNYDSSYFDNPTTLSDEKIVDIASKMYDLNEFINPATFKSYEELKAKVEQVYGDMSVTQQVSSAKSTVKTTSVTEETTPWSEDNSTTDTTTNALNDPEMKKLLEGIEQI